MNQWVEKKNVINIIECCLEGRNDAIWKIGRSLYDHSKLKSGSDKQKILLFLICGNQT